MNLSVKIKDAQSGAYLQESQLPVRFRVLNYGFSVHGGPKRCDIEVFGERLDLYQLLTLLGSRLEIWDEAEPVWWGKLWEITMNDGAFELGVSLDSLFNRVKVLYSTAKAGYAYAGEAEETPWTTGHVSETVAGYSQDIWGVKELIYSMSDASLQSALAKQIELRTKHSRILPSLTLTTQQSGETSMIFTGRGEFETFKWIYYANDTGIEGYTVTGSGAQHFGNLASTTMIAQSFQLGSSEPWTAQFVLIRCRKFGLPTDQIRVDLCSDTAGAPGTVLATAYFDGVDLTETYQDYEGELSVLVNLALSTTYWIKVSRTGALDIEDFYAVDINTALGYTRGVFRVWNGSAWVVRQIDNPSPPPDFINEDADMIFSIAGLMDTGLQMRLIYDAANQFCSGRLIFQTDVFTSQYRGGELSAHEELLSLLDGGNANNKRLYVNVNFNGLLEVYEEPDRDDVQKIYKVKRDGTVLGHGDSIIDLKTCPYGIYLIPYDEQLPIDDNLFALSDIFIDEAEYNAESDEWLPSQRTTDDLNVSGFGAY